MSATTPPSRAFVAAVCHGSAKGHQETVPRIIGKAAGNATSAIMGTTTSNHCTKRAGQKKASATSPRAKHSTGSLAKSNKVSGSVRGLLFGHRCAASDRGRESSSSLNVFGE
eukprot:CAMPEP_0115487066 /NCGR_PEP_ID=MMETSP0271-20121206/60760_1 /TAXON_ID=71861 /ORGANISM="Scrippsiella trochoidea, Strain CCMP3099" /LENGTH=111 /DNA_ID=CAMNT_0002915097 /DNA_START=197 /DNA_END=532 /DNA_ORIENTATION=+